MSGSASTSSSSGPISPAVSGSGPPPGTHAHHHPDGTPIIGSISSSRRASAGAIWAGPPGPGGSGVHHQPIVISEALAQVKLAVEGGRTDVLNRVIDECSKNSVSGKTLQDKILREPVVPEGTFLHLATKLGLVDVVRALLIMGADPTVENKHGENPVEIAQGQGEMIQQVFVEELLRATAVSDIPRIEEMIKAGVDPNSWDCEEKRNSILHWAVSFANPDTVQYLIEKGAQVNAETTEGVTPLHDAVDRGDVAIVQVLLDANASPLMKAETGKFANMSPLDLASVKPDIFSLVSQYLANQFKNAKRGPVNGDLGAFSHGDGFESPIYPKEPFPGPLSSRGRRLSSTSGSMDFVSIHTGFNSALEGVIRALELKSPVSPIVTDTRLSLLWPQPKNLHQLEGLHFRPEKTFHISVQKSKQSVHGIIDVFSRFSKFFLSLGYHANVEQVDGPFTSGGTSFLHSSLIQCCVNPDVLPQPSSYILRISSQKVRIAAADILGFQYGLCTFLQVLNLYTSGDGDTLIPPIIINDYPSLKHRAVVIDTSHERIPTIESLFELIHMLAFFKINFIHLHLRLDKNGTYRSYPKSQIMSIDRECSNMGITLVPAVDVHFEVTTTDYFRNVKPILQELLPCFTTSKHIHLGPQLTSLIFTPENSNPEVGFGLIWDFIPVLSSDTIVMLCYNAVLARLGNYNSLLDVPSNVILVDYGFQADYNFGEHVQELAQNGCSTCVCAGTSAWSSLAGTPEAALCNIYHATVNAVRHSSLGLIVANWSGGRNYTPRVFALPGFLLGSGLSWNHQTHWEYLQGSLANLMNTFVLMDKSGIAGQVVLQLGCSETSLLRASCKQPSNDVTNLPPSDGTILFRLLTDPDSVPLENLKSESFVKCIRTIKKCQASLLLETKMTRAGNHYYEELVLTIELMLLACKIGRVLISAGVNPRSNMGLSVVNLGIANLPLTVRTDIANKLLILIENYRKVWALDNQKEGMDTSLHALSTLLQRFIPDSSRFLTTRMESSETGYLSDELERLELTNGESVHYR